MRGVCCRLNLPMLLKAQSDNSWKILRPSKFCSEWTALEAIRQHFFRLSYCRLTLELLHLSRQARLRRAAIAPRKRMHINHNCSFYITGPCNGRTSVQFAWNTCKNDSLSPEIVKLTACLAYSRSKYLVAYVRFLASLAHNCIVTHPPLDFAVLLSSTTSGGQLCHAYKSNRLWPPCFKQLMRIDEELNYRLVGHHKFQIIDLILLGQ